MNTNDKYLKSAQMLLNVVKQSHRGKDFRIENKGGDNPEIYLYDVIGMWGITAQMFVDELKNYRGSDVNLHINSLGGECFDGIAIYNALKNHDGKVNVTIDGVAASAASFIAMAGDEVAIERNAQMMIHDAIGFCYGNAADMHEIAVLLDKMSDNIADIYHQRTGDSTDEWRKAMKNETWYSADEAVKAGLANSVVGSENEAQSTNQWDLSVFNYSGRNNAPAPFIGSNKTVDFAFDLQALVTTYREAVA